MPQQTLPPSNLLKDVISNPDADINEGLSLIRNIKSASEIAYNATGYYDVNGQLISYVNGAGQSLFDPSKSELYPALLPNGNNIAATYGTLKTAIIPGDVQVLNGELVCTDASSAAYVGLQTTDIVQYMRVKVKWDADAHGVLAMVLPAAGGSFPTVGGAGAADAGVHCTFTPWTTVEAKFVSCAGYGINASVIAGESSTSFLSFLGATRDIELFMNKKTGRVTVQVDGYMVIDYVDPRTKNYIGNIGIFEFFGAGLKKPKFIEMEVSSKLKPLSIDTTIRFANVAMPPATGIGVGFADTPFTIKNAGVQAAGSLVTVSAWIDQTGGDTFFRLTDGIGFSAEQCVARGTFSGRIFYTENQGQAPVSLNNMKIQARNTLGTATFGAFSSIGYQKMIVTGCEVQ